MRGSYGGANFTDDLRGFDVPTLVLHGDDDQTVPIANSAPRTAQIVRGATLRADPGLPHGMCATHKGQINADLLAFLRA